MQNNLASSIFMLILFVIVPGVCIADFDYKESKRIIDTCTVNLRCPQGFEAKQIEIFSSLIKRDAQGLSLGLDDGKLSVITLKDHLKNDAGFKKHAFITYFAGAGYYLVHRQQYEGGPVYLYINARSGVMENSVGYRHFSPDGEHFVVSHIDIDNEFPDNWISINKLNDKGYQQEWSIVYQPEQIDGKTKYTGPTKLKWLDKNKIELEELSIIVGRSPSIKNKAYLERVNNKWVYTGRIKNIIIKQYESNK